MKVDLEESKENVGKRLQFIEGEITKIDQQIAEKQGSQTTLGEEVILLFLFNLIYFFYFTSFILFNLFYFN